MCESCQKYKQLLKEDFAGTLEEEQRAVLTAHLCGCASCRNEQLLLASLGNELRTLRDEPVPRHFFVYPEAAGLSRRPWLAPIPMFGKAAMALSLAGILVLGTLVAMNTHLRWDRQALDISIGAPLPPRMDLEAWESRLLASLRELSRQEDQKRVAQLREEYSRSLDEALDQREAKSRSNFTALESRFDQRLQEQKAMTLTAFEKGLYEVYRTLEQRHRQDIAAIDERILRAALHQQARSEQNEQILATLLELSSTAQ